MVVIGSKPHQSPLCVVSLPPLLAGSLLHVASFSRWFVGRRVRDTRLCARGVRDFESHECHSHRNFVGLTARSVNSQKTHTHTETSKHTDTFTHDNTTQSSNACPPNGTKRNIGTNLTHTTLIPFLTVWKDHQSVRQLAIKDRATADSHTHTHTHTDSPRRTRRYLSLLWINSD